MSARKSPDRGILVSRLLLAGGVSVLGLALALAVWQPAALGPALAPAPASTPVPAPVPAPMSPLADAAAGQAVSAAPQPRLAREEASSGLLPPPPALVEADRDRFANAEANPLRLVAEAPVSTFSLDVDTAAYAVVRRLLTAGRLPPPEAVRVEEMINYFPYAYPAPADRTRPFHADVAVAPSPWNPETRLLRIGIKGFDLPRADRPPANLVFLVDVSGSMNAADRLPLLKQSLSMLVDGLGPRDHIALVTYAGQAGVALEPTPGDRKLEIKAAIDALGAGGSTAGAAGLDTAYALARRHFDPQAVNRIILGTDGDFNVGVSDPDALERAVADQRKSGVYLSVLGFGMGNLQDLTMQKIAQAGNGTAAYIDSVLEARKVLVAEIGSTLFPIADDVKIQVEFNPAQVSAYRLIGYETRMLRREDFNNDAVDAGEIGAGHTMTALYEITPADAKVQPVDPLRYGQPAGGPSAGRVAAGTAEELAHLKIRYKLPGESRSRLIERPIRAADASPTLEAAPEDLRFAAAVAGFGLLLRRDVHLGGAQGGGQGGGLTWDAVEVLAQGARGADPDGYRAEFVQLVRTAGVLNGLAAR